MYRKTRRAKQFATMRAAKERKRMQSSSAPGDSPRELPHLRKIIITIDFDFGTRINVMRCYKSDRVDCYNTTANGVPWKKRIGISKIFEGMRKAMPAVHSL